MKWTDHPLVLALVFSVSTFGSLVACWVVIQDLVDGEGFPVAMAAFGLFWSWAAWSSGSRLFGFRPTLYRIALEEYVSELKELGYSQALENARTHCTSIPHEIVLRRIVPSAEEWHGFEKDGIRFLMERCEPGGRVRVTFFK